MSEGLDIGRSEKENVIISGIIQIAHNLGIKVIAEEVESEHQFDFLTVNGIDAIQGFYYYKPISPENLEQILQQNASSTNRLIEASSIYAIDSNLCSQAGHN